MHDHDADLPQPDCVAWGGPPAAAEPHPVFTERDRREALEDMRRQHGDAWVVAHWGWLKAEWEYLQNF
jgi:hypothetical protein